MIDQLLASTGVSEEGEPVQSFLLHQNYPNPFNPSTQIAFALVQGGRVTLAIYSAAGALITTLLDHNLAAGRHEVTWNALVHSALSAGKSGTREEKDNATKLANNPTSQTSNSSPLKSNHGVCVF